MSNIRKWLADVNSLRTSYGPHGKFKILLGPTKTVSVTRDGFVLLAASRTTCPCALWKLITSTCLNVGRICGDRAHTAFILCTELFGGKSQKTVIERLAFEILLRCCNCHRELVLASLEAGIVKLSRLAQPSYSTNQLIRSLWMSVLTPASNKDVARSLVDLMWRCYASDKLADLLSTMRTVLSHPKTYILSSEGPASLEQSTVLPFSELILEGRCHNLRISVRDETHCHKFACFCNCSASGPIADDTITLQTPSAENLPLLTCSTGAVLETVLIKLKSAMITLVCFHAAVTEQALSQFSLNGITVVDCIPEEFLSRLSQVALCPIHLDFHDYLLSSEETFPSLQSITPVNMGSIEYKLHMKGLVSSKGVGAIAALPKQLVLCGSTKGCIDCYVGWVIRALRSTCYHLEHQQRMRPPGNGVMPSDFNFVHVNGGLAELAFGQLFRELGDWLAAQNPRKISEIEEKSPTFSRTVDSPFVRVVGSYILSSLIRDDGNFNCRLLLAIVSCCKDVASAYEAVFQTLAGNMQVACDGRRKRSDVLRLCIADPSYLRQFVDEESVSSSWQFWLVFTTVMECVVMFLRVDGDPLFISQSAKKK